MDHAQHVRANSASKKKGILGLHSVYVQGRTFTLFQLKRMFQKRAVIAPAKAAGSTQRAECQSAGEVLIPRSHVRIRYGDVRTSRIPLSALVYRFAVALSSRHISVNTV